MSSYSSILIIIEILAKDGRQDKDPAAQQLIRLTRTALEEGGSYTTSVLGFLLRSNAQRSGSKFWVWTLRGKTAFQKVAGTSQ